MKRMFTSLSFSTTRMAGKGILALLCAAFCCAPVFSQNTAFGDLSAVKWKSTADFDQTISQELTRMDEALTQVNLQSTDRALFLSYKRLVSYLQSDVQAGLTVGEVFEKRYGQVLTEAPNDPDMKDLVPGTLEGLLPGLVELLLETPPLILGQ